jgi:chromosome segregation ATPase
LSNRGLKEIEEEVKQWREELDNLRRLQPSSATIAELRDEGIPALDKQIASESTKLEELQEEVEEVS